MELDSNIKKLIRIEYKAFENFMYDGKTKEQRDELAQFFTPPEISIKLIEELSNLEGNILDPTSGSGNLLAAAIIAGADATKVYGNEYDQAMVELCRNRIKEIPNRLEIAIEDELDKEFKLFALNQISRIRAQLEKFNPEVQIHRGNALHEFALTYFDKDYETFYKADSYKRINHKNLKNIDNENWDAYTEQAFVHAHEDIYADIIKCRAEMAKAKTLEETSNYQTKEQVEAVESTADISLDFLAAYGGNS